MRGSLLLMALAALPGAVLARSASCRSVAYCDGATCQPWNGVLKVTARPDGTATFAWDDAPQIEGLVLQDAPTLMVASTTADSTGSLLVVGGSGEATFSTATDFGDTLIAGFYPLPCEAAR